MKRKKYLKKTIYLLLLASMLSASISEFKASALSNSFGKENVYEEPVDKKVYMNPKEIEEAKETLRYLEKEIQKQGTDVDTEFKKFIMDLDNYVGSDEANLIRKNIVLRESIDKAMFPTGIDLGAKTDYAIAKACITYFNMMDYKLSATLLSRALYEKDTSEYQPPNNIKEGLYNTIAYKSLSNKKKYPNGSVKEGEFQNKFNKYEADAYYAIHLFTANMTKDRIKITDVYDFKESKNYGGAVEQGVKAMVRLHERGMLTYYPVRIHLIR